MGKHKPANGGRACSVTDQFRYSSFRVQHVGENAENV
jgi:hypothetical protein